MKDRIYLNTFNPDALKVAREFGFGIELDVFLNFRYEIDSKEYIELYNKSLEWIKENDKVFFHGAILENV